MLLYCLDNSDAACRSEDYPCGNRLAWQLAVVRTVSRSLLAPQQGQQLDSTSNATPQLAVVSSAGRPVLSVAPTSDASALLSLDVSCLDGERCQFLGALRLALLAVKRSSTARVLAFFASQADLPAEQCRQLSQSFAKARVPLDVVVLCPNDELSAELMACLQLLTAVSVYEQPSGATATGGSSRQPAGLSRVASGIGPRAAMGGSQAAARHQGPSATSGGGTPTASVGGAEARAQAAGADGAAVTGLMPCGQRLLLFPPPDPSLALWQQMEPLLELLQLELPVRSQNLSDNSELNTSGVEDDRGVPSQLRTGSGAGRPPLPRPARFRVGTSAAGSAATGSAGVGQRAPGLAPSGPLTSRSGARGVSTGTCRYESLDSLQHLSLDGFLRSWLPSYANFSRVLQLPSTAAGLQQQQQGGGVGDGASGSLGPGSRAAAGADGAVSALGPGRLCYISVYRLQLPRWHKLCEVHAGCMYETELPEGTKPPGTGSFALEDSLMGAEALTAAESLAQSGTRAEAALPSPTPPLARSAVARAPCPVQIHFSSRCSSAAAAAAGSADGGSTVAASRCHWVQPDRRRGNLSLVASVEDPGIVKLIWSERQGPSSQQQPQYGSIFATAEESNDTIEPATAELDLTLSPTRSQFRVVPHVKGGAVLEILYPRSAVHRPRPPGSNTTTSPVPQHHTPGAQSGGAVEHGPSAGGSDAAAQHSTQPFQQQQQHSQQHRDRYFFWLQQHWQPEGAAAVAAAAAVGQAPSEATPLADVSRASGCSAAAESGSVGTAGQTGALPDLGCRALAEHLQALLECPPEFDPQKHGSRVRCSSTPLQLGPLPFALVEEIMRASGRQLHSDGTLAVSATARSAFSATATTSAHSTAAAAMGASVTRLQAMQHHQQQLQQQQQQSLSGGPTSAASGLVQKDRTGTSQVPNVDGVRTPALFRSQIGPIGSNTPASTALKRPAGAINIQPAVGATTTTVAVGAGVLASAISGRVRSMQPSDARGTVPGFSRTTYSRVSAADCDDPRVTAAAAVAEQGPQNLARLEAARALSSHPLDEKDWRSDCDSRAEGASSAGSSGAATPRSRGYSSSGKDPLDGGTDLIAGAGPRDANHVALGGGSVAAAPTGSAAATAELAQGGPPCLSSGCTRSGLAAAAAVAAAAAAVGSSGPSLVAAVEPEAGGSCTEESSLMFELD